MPALAHPFFGEAAPVATPGTMLRVANTLVPPFRCICRIVACSYDKPGYSVGTGFFVSPYHVVTCAHVIYPEQAPRTKTIDVYPAQNGADQSGGRYRANGWAIRRGWWPKDCRTAGFDFGIVRLATPAPHGFFALRPFDPATLRGKTVHLAGYPDVPDPRAQFMHQSVGGVTGGVVIQTCGVDARGEPTMGGRVMPLTSAATGLVAHSLPASHAVSGAPLWIEENGARTLVAIHARSIDAGRTRAAVLADDGVRAQITSWMNRELPPLRR
jgi:V8-like Glu-specific endopeptidase